MWQIDREPATNIRMNRLQKIYGYRGQWRNTQWADTLESLSPQEKSLKKMENRVMRKSDPNQPLQFIGCVGHYNSEKAEAPQFQFQPVPALSLQKDKIERVRECTESFALVLASELLLTNPSEVVKAIAELKVCKALGPNGVPEKASKIFLGKR